MKDFRNFALGRHKNIVGMLVLCAAVTGGLYFYRHSRVSHEEQAHIALSETLQQRDKAFQEQTTWSDVALAAQTGYLRFEKTALAPYFLLVQAEAELHQGAQGEPVKNMERVVKNTATNSMLHDAFALKEARLLVDSNDETASAQGLKILEKLAQGNGTLADAALFYLGSYYADHDNATRAHELWKTLTDKFSSQQPAEMSPWAQRAQAHLQQHNG